METHRPTLEQPPVPAVAHLSGGRRGATERLAGDRLRIGRAVDSEIRLADADPVVAAHHATLVRRGRTYELTVEPGSDVWVNGERATQLVLHSGDVLEIGREGPVLRFRLYESGAPRGKSLAEAFADCLDCARYETGGPLRRATRFLASVPIELATQTTIRFRAVMVTVLVALATVIGILVQHTITLERRLANDRAMVEGIAELMQRRADNPATPEEIAALLTDLRASLNATDQRVGALEGRAGATARVIAAASRSTAFIQGAYGFVDPKSRLPLRIVVGPDGKPVRGTDDLPALTTDSLGPIFQVFFTGTAFVATRDGLLITNRHVAIPWEFEAAAQRVISHGWEPVMHRLVAYLPGIKAPFDVTLVKASDDADVAVLRCSAVTNGIPALPFVTEPPQAGDEVIVLGYPLGIRALMARTDPTFIERLRSEGRLNFWDAAERLSRGGQIAPLASRGIVGQVTSQMVAYDAETTTGGSGGPVLTLDGEVVAVTVGILPEFGGSNLGVPAAAARALLHRLPRDR